MDHLHTIVEGCYKSDRRLQRALYEHYYGYTLKIVFRYIHQYDKAVDVVNDGFIKLFRNFERFQYEPDKLEMMLMGWIKRIMINVAIDQLRRDSRQIEFNVLPDNLWQESGGSGADDTLLYKELIKSIKLLPPSYRAVFNLFVIDGFSHQEIANMLGISVGTSKSNLSKAKAYLQNVLKKENKQVYASYR